MIGYVGEEEEDALELGRVSGSLVAEDGVLRLVGTLNAKRYPMTAELLNYFMRQVPTFLQERL